MIYQTVLILLGVAAVAFSLMGGGFMDDPEVKKASADCVTELGVGENDAKTLAEKKDAKAWLSLYKNHTLRCHMKCMGLKLGIMNEKGEISVEKAKAKFNINSEEETKFLEDCIKKHKEGDLCDRAYELDYCTRLGIKQFHF